MHRRQKKRTRKRHVPISKDKFVVCTQERREKEPAQHGRQVNAVFLIKRKDCIIRHDERLSKCITIQQFQLPKKGREDRSFRKIIWLVPVNSTCGSKESVVLQHHRCQQLKSPKKYACGL